MGSNSELTKMTANVLRRLIATKEVSPVEVVQACLKQIEVFNSDVNAFLTVSSSQALREARTAEAKVQKGELLGPLHGIPVSIKDLVPTQGIRTTMGSLIFKDWIPAQDDCLVSRIRQSGAIILGKTNTPEFGNGGGVTENLLGDHCRNPWNSLLTSGASSGGAAVSVAMGMNPIAHGTDGAGSIRIPAAFCGIYGMMGTQGRITRRNIEDHVCNPGEFSRDGPLSRTVRDAGLFLQVMCDTHTPARGGSIMPGTPREFLTKIGNGIKGVRVGWSPDLGSIPVDLEVASIVEQGVRNFEDMGALVDQVDLNLDVEHLSAVIGALSGPNEYLTYGRLLEESGQLMMPYVRKGIEEGAQVPAHRYLWALAELNKLRLVIRRFFMDYDLLVLPSTSVTAFPVDHRPEIVAGEKIEPMWGWYATLFPFNLSGNPAASIPCGFTSDRLPVGLQIVGRHWDEALVLRASAAFEEARPWADRRPPLGGIKAPV